MSHAIRNKILLQGRGMAIFKLIETAERGKFSGYTSTIRSLVKKGRKALLRQRLVVYPDKALFDLRHVFDHT